MFAASIRDAVYALAPAGRTDEALATVRDTWAALRAGEAKSIPPDRVRFSDGEVTALAWLTVAVCAMVYAAIA